MGGRGPRVIYLDRPVAVSREDGSEIKPEPLDVHLAHPIAQAVDIHGDESPVSRGQSPCHSEAHVVTLVGSCESCLKRLQESAGCR